MPKRPLAPGAWTPVLIASIFLRVAVEIGKPAIIAGQGPAQ